MIDRDTDGKWKRAHALLGAISSAPADGRDDAIDAARSFFEGCGVERLGKLAGLLVRGMDGRQLMAALVPVERVVRRERLTDADLGITTEDRAARAPFPFILVADNIRSAFNLGGLFRSADSIGAEALWICGYSAMPDHPHVAKAALGATGAVPWRAFDSVREAISELRGSGRKVYALETSRDAQEVSAFQFEFPCAMLVGSERFGLEPDVVGSADACLRIDSFGIKNSLNVVSAMTVAGYAARVTYERGK